VARIDGSGPRSVAPRSEPRPAPRQNAPAAAPQQKPAPKPADNYVSPKATKSYSKGAQADIRRLASDNKKATATTNRDSSVTRSTSKTDGQNTRTQELTTSKGVLGDSKLKYTNTSTGKNQTTKNTYTADTDVFRRTQASHEREVTRTKGDTTTTQTRTQANDNRGNVKITRGESTKVANGDNSTTNAQSVTTDNRGNRSTTTTKSSETKNGDTTVTRSTKQTTGTERNTAATSKFEDGKFSVGQGTDWKNSKYSTEKSYSKEREIRPSTADSGFTQKAKNDKLEHAQKGADQLAEAGARKDLIKGEFNNVKENNTSKDPNTFVGSRVGTSGSHNVSVGADGVTAAYNREAKAGVYAEKTGSTKGKYGEASYNANAKLEAKANVDAKGKLDMNGLDASVNARVGVRAEASVGGTVKSGPVKVEGKATASAEVAAEATGKVKVTRNPPTAIAEGTVGASAVAKIEGEVKASAGPFSVKASAYGSAGAEAKASGVIGYEDGKLKIGGSAGAALGLGAGGAVNVEVDVKAIGQAAKDKADVNGDGKLGLDDAKAAAGKTVDTAKNVVNGAANKVKNFFGW
jgi:hypothetical protein